MIPHPPRLSLLEPGQRERFALLAELLLSENRKVNLTSITDPDEVRLRHFEDSLAAVPLLEEMRARKKRRADEETRAGTEMREGQENRTPEETRAGRGGGTLSLIDVGSGAGFPGLALAIALPWCRVTSLEATGKKVRFQERVARELGLDNVTVVQGRAEDLAHDPSLREIYDAATTRALGTLSVVAELTLPFVRCGGVAIAWKGPGADAEIAVAATALEELGGGRVREIPYTLPAPAEDQWDQCDQWDRCKQSEQADRGDRPVRPVRSAPPFRLVVVEKTGPTPPRYPRKLPQIKKRPL